MLRLGNVIRSRFLPDRLRRSAMGRLHPPPQTEERGGSVGGVEIMIEFISEVWQLQRCQDSPRCENIAAGKNRR